MNYTPIISNEQNLAAKDISARTLSDYREIILSRVIPKKCIIGNLQLTQITPKILSEYVDYKGNSVLRQGRYG